MNHNDNTTIQYNNKPVTLHVDTSNDELLALAHQEQNDMVLADAKCAHELDKALNKQPSQPQPPLSKLQLQPQPQPQRQPQPRPQPQRNGRIGAGDELDTIPNDYEVR